MWYQSCDVSWGDSFTFPGMEKDTIHIFNYLGATVFADALASAASLQAMLDLDFGRFLTIRGQLGSIPDSIRVKELIQVSLEGWWGPLPGLWMWMVRVVLAALLLTPCFVSCCQTLGPCCSR